MSTSSESIPSERFACWECGSFFAPVSNAPEITPVPGSKNYQRNGDCPVCGTEDPRMVRYA